MRAAVVCALAALALCAAVAVRGSDDVDDGDVVVLTADNFDETVKGEELMVVEFYAPWCGHCKHLAPEYAKAATDLKKDGVKLGKVDATVHSALAGKYKVNGYPKLFLFRNGRESDYNGPREHKGIVDYVRKQVGPAAKPLNSADELAAFTKVTADRDFTVVGFFPKGGAPSQLQSAFMMVTAKLRDDFFFGVVTDPAVAKSAGVDLSADGALVAFKGYDDLKTTYVGSTKTQNVQDWIVQQSLPIVGDFTKATAVRYQKRNLPVAKYYTKVDRSKGNAKQLTYILNRLEPLAKEFAGKLVVALASATEYAQDMEELGWKGKTEGFAIVNADGRRKYRFEGKGLNVDQLKKFAASYLAGKAEVWVKSEEVPATNDGPVTTVVGKTFDQIVGDDSKDVLIEFYAPWCGHCKTLAPKYEKLGKKFKSAGVDSVVIAKIDATANDYSSEYNVSGFPTIFFKPAGGKPKQYDGEREVAALVSYIKKNSKTKWSFKKSRK